jgi:glycerophosphoryl diester phosphodiesterase
METIFAHRGLSSEAPENTLPAFQLAIEEGCGALELDVQLTRDGHLVVFHDDQLSRTTDGEGFIKDKTLQELKELDAGSWFSSNFAGTRIPTLEEVFKLCSKEILINVEIKNVPFFYKGIETEVIDTIKRFGYLENTIVSSFDHQALAITQQKEPKVKIGILLGDRLMDPWKYIQGSGLHAFSIHPLFTFVDSWFIQRSHHIGLKVYPYTVDDPIVFEDLKSIGTDGVFTNTPTHFLSFDKTS